MSAADGEAAGGPGEDGSPRDVLHAAVLARMKRAQLPGAYAAVPESGAVAEIRALTALVSENDGDFDSRFLLGWLHWYRYQALGGLLGQAELAQAAWSRADPPRAELAKALTQFLNIFIVLGREQVPEPVVPLVASAAAAFLVREQSADPGIDQLTWYLGIWRRVWSAIPASDPERIPYAVYYAGELDARFRLSGDRADLDRAVTVLTEAIEAGSREDPAFSRARSMLGLTLRTRYAATGQSADLEHAIGEFGAALADLGGQSSYSVGSMLGGALRLRFERADEGRPGPSHSPAAGRPALVP